MTDLQPGTSPHDFSGVHAAMRRYVDGDILPGISHAVLRGRELVDVGCTGWADKEAGVLLRTDHLFRAMSNTKLFTSIAALALWEEGRFQLDDPIERWVPQLARRQVLKPGAKSLADTEAAHSAITIRQLFTHSSGLSYGLFDPGTLLYKAYTERPIRTALVNNVQLMDALQDLPLAFQPGRGWEYSIATDVLGHLVELIAGKPLGQVIDERIGEPLGLRDTHFLVPEDQQHRLAGYYVGADALQPMKPGLTKLEGSALLQSHVKPMPRQSGGGGLATSLSDMVALMRSLMPAEQPGQRTVLQPETIALMMRNHLAAGQNIGFPFTGEIPGRGFGLGGCVTAQPAPGDPAGSTSEFQWGGLAGTHWWINPRLNLAGVTMTQRHFGFWNPFAFDFKQRVYAAVGA